MLTSIRTMIRLKRAKLREQMSQTESHKDRQTLSRLRLDSVRTCNELWRLVLPLNDPTNSRLPRNCDCYSDVVRIFLMNLTSIITKIVYNWYRPIIGRLLDADNRPLSYQCISQFALCFQRTTAYTRVSYMPSIVCLSVTQMFHTKRLK